MLNLSQLRFEVDSSQLEKAVGTIREIGTAMDSLAKSSGKVTTSAEDTAKVIQKTSKVVKDSNEDVADSGDKVTAALEKATNALRFQAEGYSKGQSSQLAYLKSLGATTEQLKEYGDVLQKQRVLQGTDPFDASLSSMVAIRNEYRLLVDAQRQYGSGAELTMQQMKDLTIEKMRLITTAQMEGTSFKELRNSIRQLEAQYETAAGKVNNLRAAQAAQDKAAKDTANANAYIAKEMERVTFATSAMNSELNRSTTNALLRFEKQLKLSGLSVDEQTAKLNAYKAALLQMDAASKKTNTDYVSRALGPQITDIFVGLSTGQSPLTVMLQQGGQLRDQFALAGIEADKMGQMMRNAAADMVVSVKAVALAFGQLIGGAFIDAGKGLVNYISEVSLFNKAITSMQERTAAAAATGNMWALSLQALGHILPTVLGVAIAASSAALVAMAVAFYQVNKAQNEMSRNLVSFGASLGLTSQQAFDMAKNVSASGSSFTAILDVFSEIAKKGNIAQESMQGITEAALKLESVGGNAATKTVELFSKLADDPVKALSEYAQATGLVTQAEILRIEALTKAGQEATATAEATRILEAAVKQEADLMYASLSPISRLWLDIKNGTKSAWAAVQEFAGSEAVIAPIKTVLQTIAVIATEVWFAVKGIGESLGGLGALASAVMTDIKNLDTNFTSSKKMLDLVKETDEARKQSYQDAIDRIMQQGKYERTELERTAQLQAKERQANSEAEQERLQYQTAMKPWLEYQQKHAKDMMTRQEFVNKALEDANKKLKEGTQLRQKDIDLITKMAGMEWDKSNKSKSSKEKTETYSVVADNTAAQLQKEYNAELSAAKTLSADKLDILKAELSAKLISQSEYNSQAEALIAQSEQNQFNVISDYVRQINEAYDNMRKKKDEAFASLPEKDQQNEQNIQKYKADIENLSNAQQAFNAQVSSTVAKLDSDIFKRNTKNAIEHRGAIEALSKAYEDYLVSEGKVAEQRNRENVLREQLRWATPEQAAYIQAVAKETDRLTQAQQKLADAVREANKEFEEASKNGPNPAAQKLAYEKLLAAQSAYNKALAENSVKEQQAGIDAVINYQRDQLKEFSDGLSDAIVTAMFEGGKAGASKFRDIVVAQLKKPVVMIVNAVVNTLLGSIIGSIGSSIFGSAVGGTGGNILGSIGSIGGILSIGKNIYSAITGGFSALSGQVATWAQSGMNLISGTGGTIAQGPIQVGATASGLGTVAAYGAGITGGVMGGRLISGGYSAFGGSGNTAVNAGTLIGSWFGPVGALAGGLIGGTVNRLFGRKLKESGIEGKFGGDTGFEGNRYEYYKGGLFRSNKTKRYPLEEETRKALADQYFVLRDGVKKMAEDLGLGTQALENFSYKFKLNLKGLSPEDANKAILGELEKMTEAMAQQLIGSWENGTYVASEYARENETALETLTRLSTSLSTVNAAFDMLGVTLLEGSLAGADAASALIDLFGGIGNFNNAIGSYYSNFYSEQERAAKATEILTNEFKNQGLVLPNTREEYRKLVEAQDISTEEGRKMYKFLIDLAPAFAEISDVLKNLNDESRKLEIELLRSQGNIPEANAKQREIDIAGYSDAEIAAYDYNQNLREQIRVLQQLADLQEQSTSLEIEFLRARGLTAEADARQRQTDIAGMSEAEIAAYDYNRTLRQQIEVLKRLAKLQEQSTSLEIEFLRARGLTAEADARQRAIDIADFSEAEIVAYDYNQRLREQIRVLQQLNELQKQSTILEIELLRARGLTAEADARQRELEIAGMTAAQVALYDYNRALKGQIDSIMAAASALDGLSNTRFDLENQLLTAQGNTIEVDRRTRERDLARLTEGLTEEQAAAVIQAYDYNIALGEQIRVQEEANRAAQQAADAANQAAQQAADAAKAVKDAWQSITDSIMEEVKRIRNIVRGEDSQSLAYYQQQFAVNTAAARSGDQEAAKMLPELSKTLLDLAEINATSYFELQLYRSRTAASLEETARILSGAYGTTIPSFDVGTNYVTKDMTARIHQGEAILPKAFNPWAGGSLPSNAGDSERMSNLEDKLVTLANTVTTIAISTNKINRLLERVSRDGDALQVSVVS